VFKSVIQYYNDKGGTVYAASLDISKTFDKVSHCKLLNIPVDTGLLPQLWKQANVVLVPKLQPPSNTPVVGASQTLRR